MKTTHELAAELLALPNVPLMIEGWVQMKGYEATAQMLDRGIDDHEYGQAIITQQLLPGYKIVPVEGLSTTLRESFQRWDDTQRALRAFAYMP